ncbi:biorientation of chromosomes in cell division protein 1-like 1 [Anopheles maculipalpis]|uniref:biorientation of chromosomes in cell division protein 1-like 1 n=1 Tax=Anopheles maculipalpis TaxID=1496333 RepID=UPI00215979A4|nr:biorientation of chromosomes in cell division protein 1-like 1 [Anopheles maculipalpis]
MYSIKGANICILCEKSGKIIEKIAVKTNRITIGSYPLNNIRLHTVNAERLHCKIFADSSNSVSIVNYSKSNPVRVNNCSVNSRYTLHDNDKFQVAGCLFLWNFDPANIKGVPKSRKRTIQQCRRKMITLKRVRSTGDFEKHSCVIVRRSVSLMLDAYRKRRTIHSTMSGQSMCGANISSKPCIQNASENDNAHAAVCTPSAVNTTQPNLTPLVTPHTEKENIIPANMQHLITGDLMNKSHTPVSSKRRHLACHTPVSHLIDLTTPPAKSRATSTARKALSGKAAQPPRLLDVVDIVTPSPKKFNKTPISVRSTTSTPKTTLLKSAIKNSRIHEPESKKTPLSSAFVKKTPNVKSNTPRVNTPKPTPVGYKSSTGKIRNHLISTLNDKKTVSVSKTDSPVARINLEETSKRSTPNLRKRPSATTQSRSVCVTPKGELLERCNIQTLDNVVSFAKAERNAVVESPSVVPIIDVQSIIKKPNRTTQIRSAKYSDITPHESFADGMPVAAITSEENVIALQVESSISTTCSLLEDELKCLSNMPSNANSNRNSCSSIKAAHCSGSYQKTRKTMNDISSRLPGSPSRPLSRNKLIQSNMESLKDLTKDNGMIALPTITISAEEDLDKNELLVESDLNLHLLQNDTVNNTPELRNSWRYTRNRNIGSAFTSLNASQPQLDLTAEIDESLVITEDEEAVIENNELYNLECSNSHSSTREEQMITHNASMNDRKTAQIPETTTETTSNLLSRSLDEESVSSNAVNNFECSVTEQDQVQEEAAENGMPERAGEIVQHFQNSVQSVRCENNDRKIEEISGMELKKSSTTPKVSKRRLYNKNDYLSLTPSHMLESSQTAYVAVPNEYPILLKTKKKEKKSHDVGNQIRENRPKRACRLKITNLSEEFLAGNSPASKFVEPKPEITENNDTFAANDGESSCTQNEKSETSITQNRTVDLSVAGAKKSEADLAQTLDVAAVENSRKEKEETTVSSIGRVQKKVILEETSSTTSTPIKRGRGRRANETVKEVTETEKPLSDAHKIVDLHADEDDRKMENTPIGQAAELVETDSMATDDKDTQQDKPSVGRRGRGRKQVILEETSSTTSTPIKRGRGRKAVETVKEVAVSEKLLSYADKIVDLRADEDDRKMENTPIGQATELVETDSMATDDKDTQQDKPSVGRRGRGRKQVILEETSSTTSTPIKRARGRKAVETVKEVAVSEKPLSYADKIVDLRADEDDRKMENTPIGQAAELVETDSMATDDKDTQQDKPSVGRRGRGRKQVILEETSSTTSTPIKRGRGRKAVEKVKEVTETEKPLSDADKIVDLRADEDDRKMENTPIGQAAELVDSMATDDKDTQQDKLSVGRRGRGRKQLILEETSSTTSTPIKRGRGRKAVEKVKEVTETEKPLSDADKIVDLRTDKDDRKIENTPIGQAAELVETDSMATDDKNTQQDKPSVGRRGRGRKQVIIEETSSTTSTPIKRGRGRKAVETVKEMAVSEKPLSDVDKIESEDERNHIVDLREDEDNRKMENTSSGQAAKSVESDLIATDEKDIQDKPSVGKRGRGRKQVNLEETSSTTSTPIKKARGRKAVETVQEVSNEEIPRRTRAKRN